MMFVLLGLGVNTHVDIDNNYNYKYKLPKFIKKYISKIYMQNQLTKLL